MKQLIIAMAVGSVALVGGSAANAAAERVKPRAAIGVIQSSTDISANHRHYHHSHSRYYRHYGHRHYRPYYRGYGYAPRYYGSPYYGGYGYGGPSVTFSFGGGGYRGW
jgi:hypothetical protein